MEDRVTNSQIQTLSCPRRHYLQYGIGLRKTGDRRALDMGTAFHEGIHHRNLLRMDDVPNTEADAAGVAHGVGKFAEDVPPPDSEAYTDYRRDIQVVWALLTGYFWRYSERDRDIRIIDSEREFAVDVEGATQRYAGKIDMLIEYEENGLWRRAIVELKTTIYDIAPDSPYMLRLRIDQQVDRYLIASQASGTDADEVIYDVMRKPTTNPVYLKWWQTKKLGETGQYVTKATPRDGGEEEEILIGVYDKTLLVDDEGKFRGVASINGTVPEQSEIKSGFNPLETDEMFGARVLSDIYRNPGYYFRRQPLFRTAEDIEEAKRELLFEMNEIEERTKTKRWPKRTHLCTGFGTCPMLDICVDGHDLETIAKQPPGGYRIATNIHEELGEV